MSISSLLFTARDALNSNQMAIDITGSNIANVNTPGYSRQQVDLKSLGSVTVGGAGTQIGVTVSQIERIYDRFIESQIIAQQQNTGYSDTLLRGLQNIEAMIDDTQGVGISNQLSKFWSSWEDLSKNPGGIVERSALLSAAQNLTDSLMSFKRNLDTITTDLSRSISDTVTTINEKVHELKDLNKKIIEITGDNGEKNDLLDKQTQALKELGALINITHVGNADGTVNVYLSNGQPLLQGTQEETLSAKLNADGQSSDIYSSNLSGETVNSTLTSGKLGALIELQNKIVPEHINYIDTFAQSLADRVNELHRDGFDAYNNTGVNFFQILDEENSAGTIQVNSAISADVNRIAVATSVNGNGDNASLIAAVQNELLMNKTASLGSFLAATVGQIGQQVSMAKTNNDRQTVIANLLGNQRESVSGVSIDEEMIRLINYQMGYNAAGKIVSVVDEILDTLMGIIK